MGLSIERDRFEEEEFHLFGERLECCLTALRELLARPDFGAGPRSLGAELELCLVDATARPLPLNQAVLASLVDPRMTVELDRFNLECNLRHGPLAGHPFRALGREMRDALEVVDRAARAHGGRVVPIGILPTLTEDDLQSEAMTDTPRFRALSAGLQRLRRSPFAVHIDGPDPLSVTCQDVTLEGANTSVQVHLRVEPAEFARIYNAIQLVTPLVLALSGNSPLFLGHRLWHETRIALFKQAVDDRAGKGEARVSFGSGWVRDGAYELFAESVALHQPLLPILGDEDPQAQLARGAVPRLEELRLHQGTVWRWNRAIYDPAEGGHLRIEMRFLPAGPSVDDMLANAAFAIGLALGIGCEIEAWTHAIPFQQVHDDFYRAAQFGPRTRLLWPPAPGTEAQRIEATELALQLLPTARRGLAEAGVAAEDSEPLLEIMGARAESGRTGALWQLRSLEALEDRLPREKALGRMVERYLEHAVSGSAVHTWPVAR